MKNIVLTLISLKLFLSMGLHAAENSKLLAECVVGKPGSEVTYQMLARQIAYRGRPWGPKEIVDNKTNVDLVVTRRAKNASAAEKIAGSLQLAQVLSEAEYRGQIVSDGKHIWAFFSLFGDLIHNDFIIMEVPCDNPGDPLENMYDEDEHTKLIGEGKRHRMPKQELKLPGAPGVYLQFGFERGVMSLADGKLTFKNREGEGYKFEIIYDTKTKQWHGEVVDRAIESLKKLELRRK
ncbi:MAG: hypothetical protein WCL39_09240 [Armatimonadota bacterium]